MGPLHFCLLPLAAVISGPRAPLWQPLQFLSALREIWKETKRQKRMSKEGGPEGNGRRKEEGGPVKERRKGKRKLVQIFFR